MIDGNLLSMLLVILVFIASFYFLIFLPNKRQRDAHKKLIDGLRPEDKIITVGGIFGTVSRVNKDTILVKVSDRTEILFSKDAIRSVNAEEPEVARKPVQEVSDDDEDFMTDEEIAEKRRKKKQSKKSSAAKETDNAADQDVDTDA